MSFGTAFGPVSLGHESFLRVPEDVMKFQSEPEDPQSQPEAGRLMISMQPIGLTTLFQRAMPSLYTAEVTF